MKKKKGKLSQKILAVAMVPMFLMAVAVAVVSTMSMRNALKTEMMGGIEVSADAMNVLYNSINDDSFLLMERVSFQKVLTVYQITFRC